MIVYLIILFRVRHHLIGELLGLTTLSIHTFVRLVQLILHYFNVVRQGLIRLSQFMLSVSERAIIAKFTFTLCLEKFTYLRFIVAIRDVHHLQHELIGQWLKISKLEMYFKLNLKKYYLHLLSFSALRVHGQNGNCYLLRSVHRFVGSVCRVVFYINLIGSTTLFEPGNYSPSWVGFVPFGRRADRLSHLGSLEWHDWQSKHWHQAERVAFAQLHYWVEPDPSATVPPKTVMPMLAQQLIAIPLSLRHFSLAQSRSSLTQSSPRGPYYLNCWRSSQDCRRSTGAVFTPEDSFTEQFLANQDPVHLHWPSTM